MTTTATAKIGDVIEFSTDSEMIHSLMNPKEDLAIEDDLHRTLGLQVQEITYKEKGLLTVVATVIWIKE